MNDSFIYRSFEVEPGGQTVQFGYEIIHGGQRFELAESLRFPTPLPDNPAIQAGLRALHLALGVSYYKIFVSPKIVQPYQMSAAEADFWNSAYRNGLGEFLYVNDLTPEVLAKFSAQEGQQFPVGEPGNNSGVLLALGGGKDSIVAGELMKSLGQDVSGFVMATGQQLGQTKAVAETMGITLLTVERRIDPKLLELQKMPDAYRGHVPISLIFGLTGTVLALATGKKFVVVGNEASASLPRIQGNFGAVNHQWSKSLEAEAALQAFIHSNIDGSLTYFSAIREMSSVAVAKTFASYPAYFEVFTSDNSVFRLDPGQRPAGRWSLTSPKSLSSFILLGPWLAEADLLRTFSRNFLDEASLESLFLSLIGVEGEQPLDCVGTVDELTLSLNLLTKQGKFSDSHLMKLAVDRNVIKDSDWDRQLKTMLELSGDQALPAELKGQIEQKLAEELAR